MNEFEQEGIINRLEKENDELRAELAQCRLGIVEQVKTAIEKDRRERKALPEVFVPWLIGRASDSYSCGLLVKGAIELLHAAFKDPNDPLQIPFHYPPLNFPIQGFSVDLEFGHPGSAVDEELVRHDSAQLDSQSQPKDDGNEDD